jgi:hypothetical protein
MGDRNLGRDGHTSGGSFARGQQESRDHLEPEETGSFPRANGQVY